MSKHRCYGARFGSFLLNSDSKSHRYGAQKNRFCGEFVGAKLREKSRKKCRDIRCETEHFLTIRPRLGLCIGGFLNIFLILKSEISVLQNTDAMVLVSG